MSTKPAKLQDIAEKAGVSAMTVSLALRGGKGSARMSPETLKKVLQAAESLNYSPNARARALRTGRTNVVGLYAGHGWVNVRSPFFTEIVSGLQEGCEETRRDLLLHGVFHGSSPDDLYRELADGRIDGLIVSMPAEAPLAKKLAGSGLAVVAVADALPGIPSVVVDDSAGMQLAVEHLYGKGHRKVAFAHDPPHPASEKRRCDAFLAEGRRLGMDVGTRNLVPDADPTPYLREAIDSGITALVCWNDQAARFVLRHAAEAGIRVPEDLAIIGFDGIPLPFGIESNLTTVAAPWSEVARTAVHHLNKLLSGSRPPMETVLPVTFQGGSTT